MSINANPVITKLKKASGGLAAGNLESAMNGEDMPRGLKWGEAARVVAPLSSYRHHPEAIHSLNSRALKNLVCRCLDRIAELEGKP